MRRAFPGGRLNDLREAVEQSLCPSNTAILANLYSANMCLGL